METKLKIVWDGEVPGLKEHRLSVSSFGKPLSALLAALRRIASNIITEAVGNEKTFKGRINAEAALIDLQIVNLESGSLGVVAECTVDAPQGQQVALFNDLALAAGVHLLDSLAKESKGQLANHAVRKYLTSLPGGVKRQSYSIYLGDKEVQKVEIGDVSIADVPETLPQLMGYTGGIIGVGFEPGRNEVKIKTEDGGIITFSATTEQVEQALKLRSYEIWVTAVGTGKKLRLLQIKQSEVGDGKVSPEMEEEYLFKRWDELLHRLAQ